MRQFKERETLKSCIKQYWNEIQYGTLRKLIDSIQNKCVEVLQLKGNTCKYWIFYNFAVKYKFSKLSYTYFHPRKLIFLNNFLGWKVVIKLNMYTNTDRILVPLTHFQRNLCCNKKINNLMGFLILISTAVYHWKDIYDIRNNSPWF